MFKKTKLPEVEPVVLKPWHGVRPAYYILALFFLFLLVLFFLLCLLPGLVSNRAYVRFDTSLPILGVYEDGRYLGNGYGTKLETTAGEHTYTFTYEGITIGEQRENVKRHYFFTLFSHKSTLIKPVLTYSDEAKSKAVEAAAEDIASFSAMTDFSASAVYPEVMEKFAETAAEMNINDVRDIWLYSILHITSKTMYDDYAVAKAVLDEAGITYETEESRKVESFLSSLYSDGNSGEITKRDETTEISVTKDGSFYRYNEGTVTLGKTTSPDYPQSDYIPRTLTYSSFSIASSLITENEYAQFVEANPEWSRDNIDELVSSGLVDSNYLKNINLSSRSSRPVRSISWYAAEAYAEWRSSKDGVEYSLPTFTEWTVAALSAAEKDYVTSLVFVENNSSTPTSLMGQLWDMTESVYIPLMRLVGEETLSSLETLFPYDDIIVAGGSYVNENISLEDMGTAHKYSCSEFNGFRLVKHE